MRTDGSTKKLELVIATTYPDSEFFNFCVGHIATETFRFQSDHFRPRVDVCGVVLGGEHMVT